MMATTWMMGEHLKNSYDDEAGVLLGLTITEVYGFYVTGQLKEKYYNAQFDNDFSRMRNRVIQLLQKEETERRIR